MHQHILTNLVLLTGFAVLVVYLGHRLRLPGIVGFLLTGVLVGPGGLGLISSSEEVELLAEIGVIALLFTIGLEFSLGRLWEMRSALLLGGSAQVVLTIVVAALISWRLGQAPNTAIFIGFLVALSSTAVVLALLESKGEINSPHGRTVLGILLFQDVIVVALMLAIPLLTGGQTAVGPTAALLLGKAMLVIIVVVVATRWVVPAVLYRVTRIRDRELFLLTVVFLALGVAWLTNSLGLSLALGAFLAGLIVSESEYSHRALSSFLPLRDVFTSFFFISVGMLLDVQYVLSHPLLVLALALGVMLLKALLAMAAAALLRLPVRTVVLSGLALCQVGEFSFILYQAGHSAGLVAPSLAGPFLAVAVISLLLTPLVMGLAPQLAEAAQRLPLPRRLAGLGQQQPEAEDESLSDHLVIFGFGFNGSNLARVAKAAGIPYVILEMNPDTVLRERLAGEPIRYGDVTQEAALHQVSIETARIAVLAISDAAATRRAVELIRRLSPACTIITRTRFVAEIEDLQQLGAHEVIPEEFETAIAIFTRVLHHYQVPRSDSERFADQLRLGSYQLLRGEASTSEAPLTSLLELIAAHDQLDTATLYLCPNSPLAGQTLAGSNLRQEYGVTVLAVIHEDQPQPNPAPNTLLHPGDTLIVMGPQAALSHLAGVCQLEAG